MKWLGVTLAALLAVVFSVSSEAQAVAKQKPASVIDATRQKQILDVLTLAGVHKALEESAAAYEKQLKRGIPEEALQEDLSLIHI